MSLMPHWSKARCKQIRSDLDELGWSARVAANNDEEKRRQELGGEWSSNEIWPMAKLWSERSCHATILEGLSSIIIVMFVATCCRKVWNRNWRWPCELLSAWAGSWGQPWLIQQANHWQRRAADYCSAATQHGKASCKSANRNCHIWLLGQWLKVESNVWQMIGYKSMHIG